MMNHADGWMSSWIVAEWMWLWPVMGVLVVAMVLVAMKVRSKRPS